MTRLPTSLRLAVIAEVLGILFLTGSLFVSTPPAYLSTIGLGVCALLFGLFCFLVFFIKTLRQAEDAPEGV